ncbi:MAG TPA: RNA 2'-phosphotransferase [Kineosporiaceae bacterium]
MRMLTHERLSKVVAHALRHEPWLYELELDDEGWVPVDELLEALAAKGSDWAGLGASDIEAMLASSSKQRYELAAGRIRALYGHSVPGRLAKQKAVPPEILYHGTSPPAWVTIRSAGLAPMGRQYVHLSVDEVMAGQVGRRKAARAVVVRVRAGEAARNGVPFYRGNEHVWLADGVPARYLEAVDGASRPPPCAS